MSDLQRARMLYLKAKYVYLRAIRQAERDLAVINHLRKHATNPALLRRQA